MKSGNFHIIISWRERRWCQSFIWSYHRAVRIHRQSVVGIHHRQRSGPKPKTAAVNSTDANVLWTRRINLNFFCRKQFRWQQFFVVVRFRSPWRRFLFALRWHTQFVRSLMLTALNVFQPIFMASKGIKLILCVRHGMRRQRQRHEIKFHEDTSREITPENMPLQIKLSSRTLCRRDCRRRSIAPWQTQYMAKKQERRNDRRTRKIWNSRIDDDDEGAGKSSCTRGRCETSQCVMFGKTHTNVLF